MKRPVDTHSHTYTQAETHFIEQHKYMYQRGRGEGPYSRLYTRLYKCWTTRAVTYYHHHYWYIYVQCLRESTWTRKEEGKKPKHFCLIFHKNPRVGGRYIYACLSIYRYAPKWNQNSEETHMEFFLSIDTFLMRREGVCTDKLLRICSSDVDKTRKR